MAPSIEIFNTAEEIAGRFGELLTNLEKKSSIEWVLSGGNTPKPVFQNLSTNSHTIDWNKIHFYWGDERCVDPGNPDSNYRMAKEALFEKIHIQENQQHRIHGENDPEQEARRYAGEIMKNVPESNGYPAFRLIMLGLGEDGHTASIFPDQMDLLDTEELCAVAIHPQTGQKRISLTGNVLNNARQVVFLVTGHQKADIVSRIINKKEGYLKYPAAHIRPNNGKLTWLIDKSTASRL